MRVEITGINTAELKTISNKEMMGLIDLVKTGDIDARDKLIKGNLKLILSILKKFHNRGENLDDLFQVGTIGLMKAIDNFDTKHNVMFSTYAVPMIIGEIKRHLRDSSSIRVSRSLKDIAYKTLLFKERFMITHQREPKINEIAEELEVPALNVILALEAVQDSVSMNTPIYNNNGDTIDLSDQMGEDDNNEKDFERERMIKKAIGKLEKREKEIIYDRYFKNKTQTEIANEIGISQAQVSRLEKNALNRMKREIIL